MTVTLHPSRKAGRVLTLLSLTGLCAAALPAQAEVITIASFPGNQPGSTGGDPTGGVILDSSGNLFGTTFQGGASGQGTVYEIKNGTSAISTLLSFTGYGYGTKGGGPYGGVTFDSSGNLFGTTADAGTSGYGSVYKIDMVTGTFTTLAFFTGSNGATPYGSVSFDSNGNLFGTTRQGGTFNGGTVYEIDKLTGTFSSLASFAGTNGAAPYGSVSFDSSGNLFGTTSAGGTTSDGTTILGTAYEIYKGTTTIKELTPFTTAGTIGGYPHAGVTFDGSGNLFGTTYYGGTSGAGTVYEIAKGTSIITTLASFAGDGHGTNGGGPESGVTFDRSGNLFGTTVKGGTYNAGTVYEIAGAGSPVPESSTVLSFATLLGLGGLLLRAHKRRQNVMPGV